MSGGTVTASACGLTLNTGDPLLLVLASPDLASFACVGGNDDASPACSGGADRYAFRCA